MKRIVLITMIIAALATILSACLEKKGGIKLQKTGEYIVTISDLSLTEFYIKHSDEMLNDVEVVVDMEANFRGTATPGKYRVDLYKVDSSFILQDVYAAAADSGGYLAGVHEITQIWEQTSDLLPAGNLVGMDKYENLIKKGDDPRPWSPFIYNNCNCGKLLLGGFGWKSWKGYEMYDHNSWYFFILHPIS